MRRSMKVDYYKVTLPKDEKRAFADIIGKVAKSPDDKRRNETHNNMPMRLQEAQMKTGIWIGDMVKIRMDGIPPKTKLSGEQEDIDLDDDEGLGEETAFLFDPKTRVLAIQRNRFAVSANAFAAYWVLKCGVRDVKLDPVIRPDALKRMATLKTHRKLEVSVAPLDRLDIFDTDNMSIAALTTLSEEFRAPSVSLTISMGHIHGSLEHVRAFINALRRTIVKPSNGTKGEPVTKVLVSGRKGDDEPLEVIDLLEDRMADVEEVDLGRDHEASRTARQNAVERAYNKRKDDLAKMFEE